MVKDLTADETEEAKRAFLAAVGEETRFKPGQSGNPEGRAKEPDDLIELLRYVVGKKNAREMFQELVRLATNEHGEGNVPYHVRLGAIDTVLDRLVGKPRQVGLSTGDDDPLILKVLRALTDDTTALAGRSLPAIPQSVDATEVREIDSK